MSEDKDKKTQSVTSPRASMADKAQAILTANLLRIQQKLVNGQGTLTKAELDFVKEQAGKIKTNSEEPQLAKNQSELAAILGVSRKTIQRKSKHPDAPKARPNGSCVVSEWREFLGQADEDDDLDANQLKAKQILLQNNILEHKYAVMRGEFIAVEDVQVFLTEMITAAKKVLLTIPPSLAPQVVGETIAEAEKLLRNSINDALERLTADPTSLTDAPAEDSE